MLHGLISVFICCGLLLVIDINFRHLQMCFTIIWENGLEKVEVHIIANFLLFLISPNLL